jgi:hypothetical protein
MEITINLSKEVIEHLKYCTSPIDSCGYVEIVIDKVKEKINKKN